MLIFTFPGQGSQRPGMGKEWENHPSWEIVDLASESSGRNISHLLLEADKDELKQTRNAQLATFVLSLVVLDSLERVGLEPGGVAGHSLGEYSALVASGAIGLDDGINLVVERGEAMQQAAEDSPGTMAAVLGMDDDSCEAACMRSESDVWIANYNAPGQIVVAGTEEAIAKLTKVAKEMGAKKVLPIPVGGAFHSPLMASAKDRLRKAINSVSFSDPEIPIIANVDAQFHQNASDWPSLLSAQLCSPVRWHQTLARFESLSPRAYVEVGTGGVLVGLAKRIFGDSKALVVSKPDDVEFLLGVLSEDKPLQAYVASHGGEQLQMTERVIVASASGIFEPVHFSEAPTPIARNSPQSATRSSLQSTNNLVKRSDLEQKQDQSAITASKYSPYTIHTGDVVGHVSGTQAISQFSGLLMGYLVMPGERVAAGQPIAWLTVPED